jgi:hypothetical protein
MTIAIGDTQAKKQPPPSLTDPPFNLLQSSVCSGLDYDVLLEGQPVDLLSLSLAGEIVLSPPTAA